LTARAAAPCMEPPPEQENPFPRVVDRWERVMEDMHATAEEYRDAGWEVVAIHPGDVTVVDPRDIEADGYDLRAGLDVLAPDDEYDRLHDLVADRTFGEYEVLRAVENRVVFLVVLLEADAGDAAVLVPAYYDLDEAASLRSFDHLHTQVRRLKGGPVVTFTHEDPTPFLPDE
jgi:hypothetical protein